MAKCGLEVADDDVVVCDRVQGVPGWYMVKSGLEVADDDVVVCDRVQGVLGWYMVKSGLDVADDDVVMLMLSCVTVYREFLVGIW